MINEILEDAGTRMDKSVEAIRSAFGKIRTGRASPDILDGIVVPYYGVDTPLNQVAAVIVEDARNLTVTPWEKHMIVEIEKAILRSGVGITPTTTGDVIRLPMPPLTEENRQNLTKVARNEAENGRIAVRNIRRDALTHIKDFEKESEISKDEAHKASEQIQKLTDAKIADVDHALAEKESDLLQI
ncbi:MAG: ribosome recycling factor [Pseudomonadales bacterium]|nr:ribosome recycling factor [Pseudomonadales bacterium]